MPVRTTRRKQTIVVVLSVSKTMIVFPRFRPFRRCRKIERVFVVVVVVVHTDRILFRAAGESFNV